VGTAASLLPIRSLARPSTGENFVYGEKTGECTARLSAALRDIMRGKIEDAFGWVDVLREEDMLLPPQEEKVEEPVMNGVNMELPLLEADVQEKGSVIVSAPVEVQVEA
jgi:branched-chain amino acid aminotransferase